MDINFMSYVSLMMLFLAQPELKTAPKHCFHIVNVSSIAGHLTCCRNSDYSASKFALNGFVEALRQELNTDLPNIALTTFYPYYINTGLFEGFKPKLGMILPTLEASYVVDVMYNSIMSE